MDDTERKYAEGMAKREEETNLIYEEFNKGQRQPYPTTAFRLGLPGRYELSICVPHPPRGLMGETYPMQAETALFKDGEMYYEEDLGYGDVKRFDSRSRASDPHNTAKLWHEYHSLIRVLNEREAKQSFASVPPS